MGALVVVSRSRNHHLLFVLFKSLLLCAKVLVFLIKRLSRRNDDILIVLSWSWEHFPFTLCVIFIFIVCSDGGLLGPISIESSKESSRLFGLLVLCPFHWRGDVSKSSTKSACRMRPDLRSIDVRMRPII
jgi:hypothetical protein